MGFFTIDENDTVPASPAVPNQQLDLFALLLALAFCGTLSCTSFIGFGLPWVAYPFNLYTTFIHEGSHAIMALATGGRVVSLTVSPDGSGLTTTMTAGGIAQLLVSFAGYLGSTCYGALMLLWSNRTQKAGLALQVSAITLLGLIFFFTLFGGGWLSGAFWETITTRIFTMGSGLLFVAALWCAAALPWQFCRKLLLDILALESLINAMGDIRTVFVVASTNSQQNDASNLAALTGIPAVAWVGLWLIMSTVLIALVLKAVWAKHA